MNFGKKSRSNIKKIIIRDKLLSYECDICHNFEWLGKKLSLHLDHINGIHNDNRLDNLRFLCPNCHSQTDTYCRSNISVNYSTKFKKISDEILIEAMKNNINPKQALEMCNLSGASNYNRIYRLAEMHHIDHMKKGSKRRKSIISGVEINIQKQTKICEHPECGNEIPPKNKKYCSPKCFAKSITKTKYTTEEIYKIWIDNNKNYTKTSKIIGLTDNAIRKRIKMVNPERIELS